MRHRDDIWERNCEESEECDGDYNIGNMED